MTQVINRETDIQHNFFYYNSQDMKATYAAIDRWMDETDVIHTHKHTQWNIMQQ